MEIINFILLAFLINLKNVIAKYEVEIDRTGTDTYIYSGKDNNDALEGHIKFKDDNFNNSLDISTNGIIIYTHINNYEEVLQSKLNIQCVFFVTKKIINPVPQVQEVSNVVTLYVECGEINAIPSLDAFPNLLRLYIKSDYITSIPSLDALTKLKTLHLECNRLTKLPSLAALENLRQMLIIGDQLESVLTFENLKSIEILYIQGNKITSISPLTALNYIKYLYVIGNMLSFEIIKLYYLKALYIHGDSWVSLCKLRMFAKTLLSLDIHCNNIQDTQFDVCFLVNLRHLAIVCNNMQTFNYKWFGVHNLKTLIIASNNLRIIPFKLKMKKRLQRVYIQASDECNKVTVTEDKTYIIRVKA